MALKEEVVEATSNIKSVLDVVKKLIFNEETWVKVGFTSIKIVFIILISFIIVSVLKSVIRRVFSLKLKSRLRPTERREKTLVKLLENAVSYIIYFAAILAILAEFIDISGLLAGAGVLGLAIGFGAQSLVKDVISGFFIIFEDQFSVGDYVMIGTALGTVEEIGLRTTKLSAYGGEIHIIPNGNIAEVINYSINNSLAIIDVRIGYDIDIQRAEDLIEEFLKSLPIGYGGLIAQPTLIGVQDLAASEIVFGVTAQTEPVMQWAFARIFRKDLKLFLDQHGIEIPYPKMVVYHKEERGEQE
ncbi:mechanosensitive ion channel family protein [Sporosarcina siberiensis]|uniref:Mechanosensitive ion channel family protein n=1 Tax=Sporosarcina siberiensis TaxID=1365606 RepID=A0ABW4SH75_9BACL